MATEEAVKYVSIIGSTGYVGAELVRGFANHPYFRFRHLTSQTFAGKPYSDIYPEFRGIVDNLCEDLPYAEVAKDSDLVITALPHGVSAKIVPELLAEGVKVIDHSGDFRYKDLATYEKSYKLTHPNPELLQNAVYGLPEFYRDQLKTADNKIDIFFNRIKRNIIRHRFVKRRCLYYIHQMEFEAENFCAAYVTYGIEHHVFVFTRQSQDKMCNNADPARVELGRSPVVSADHIAGVHCLECAVVRALESELDPEEVFFVYLLKQVKNIFT
jgi:hypothetical protein